MEQWKQQAVSCVQMGALDMANKQSMNEAMAEKRRYEAGLQPESPVTHLESKLDALDQRIAVLDQSLGDLRRTLKLFIVTPNAVCDKDPCQRVPLEDSTPLIKRLSFSIDALEQLNRAVDELRAQVIN